MASLSLHRTLRLCCIYCLLQPVSAQLSTLTLPFQIIIVLLIFMFTIPIVCKVLHLIRIQINKIRSANLFGSNVDPEYADDDEDED